MILVSPCNKVGMILHILTTKGGSMSVTAVFAGDGN